VADRAYTTTVTTASTTLRVPGKSTPNVTWVYVTPVAAAWVSPWGADAVANGDNCVFIPAGRTRGFRYAGRINGCAAADTTQIVVEAVVGESEEAITRGDYPEAI
jgi:hypothetical protein